MIDLNLQTMPPGFLKLLSQPLRWKLLKVLAHSDLKVQELVERLNQPQNLVSYHLKQLRKQELIREHRSCADGREIYYSLDINKVRALYLSSGEALHPALGQIEPTTSELSIPPVRVLFLCTQNSARSQMAEALLRSRSKGRIETVSAGTEPGEIHPLAIKAMAELNIDIQSQQSKNILEFTDQHFDYIITVCDRARETCPIFPGDPVQIHWSISDPAALQGTERALFSAFRDTAVQLNTRIGYLLLLLQRERGGKSPQELSYPT
jgi:ArsR family transcriptional regulator, arsenate/arsenite/antimonite-responsive transcriptional repressor / arsenate reductase (thioredoxin)